MAEVDPIKSALRAAAIAALRKRAERQARIAADGTTAGERGAIICSGEAAIALRLAATLGGLAAEIEAGTK